LKHGPDFIIIGAMKCATSTLHEQLARQLGVLMSTPKEPCFFSDDEVYARGATWYSSLFAQSPEHTLCGESSTHYTKLPTYPHTIERMQHFLGAHVKFIYIMRHPIDRLVSHYIHEWTQRVVTSDLNHAIDHHPELIAYSQYALQIQPYLDAFGSERVLPVFFERLTAMPHVEFNRVCEFIGYGGTPAWDEQLKEQNVSSDRMRKSAARDMLINLPGVKQARRKFVPQSLRDRIKTLWMLKQRPELSDSIRARLQLIFDEDLAKISDWLGVKMTCENFKAVARGQPTGDRFAKAGAA
jgi:hypothetical protein